MNQTLRKFQRHWLLRQYGDDGKVLPENLEVSAAIDAVISAADQAADLLAALKALQPYFEGEHAHDHPECVQMRAAIAKAEGR